MLVVAIHIFTVTFSYFVHDIPLGRFISNQGKCGLMEVEVGGFEPPCTMILLVHS